MSGLIRQCVNTIFWSFLNVVGGWPDHCYQLPFSESLTFPIPLPSFRTRRAFVKRRKATTVFSSTIEQWAVLNMSYVCITFPSCFLGITFRAKFVQGLFVTAPLAIQKILYRY